MCMCKNLGLRRRRGEPQELADAFVNALALEALDTGVPGDTGTAVAVSVLFIFPSPSSNVSSASWTVQAIATGVFLKFMYEHIDSACKPCHISLGRTPVILGAVFPGHH